MAKPGPQAKVANSLDFEGSYVKVVPDLGRVENHGFSNWEWVEKEKAVVDSLFLQ